MKKKIFKIIGITLLCAVVAFAAYVLFAFLGNPVSKAIAKNNAEDYIEAHYPDIGYTVDEIFYDFKSECYYAHIAPPTGTDTGFTLTYTWTGKFSHNNYEDAVVAHGNVIGRLDEEYRKAVDKILENKDTFPYDVSIGFGTLHFEEYDEIDLPDNAIMREALVNDKEYDISQVAATNGELVVYIYSDNVCTEEAAKVLLDLRKAFDESDMSFCWVNLVLQYAEDKEHKTYQGQYETHRFLYSDIVPEGLNEKVEDTFKHVY